jgi:epoxide hydrolase 4
MSTNVSTSMVLRAVSDLPQQELSFDNSDVRIHYRRYGSGGAIIFVHGFPDTSLTYHHQILEFAKDHTVFVPTLRGFPPSSVPLGPERYSIPELVGDIVALFQHLDLDKAHVVGHDWGGVVLQAFALFHPDKVKSLIILNSPVLQPFLNLLQSDSEQQKLSEYTLAYHAYEEGDDKNENFVVRHIRDPEWQARIAEYLRESPIHGMLSFYKMGYPAPPYGAPPPEDTSAFVYCVPTLIVWGLDDPYFSPKHLNNLWDWFRPSYRFVSVPGAGHWVHQDAAGKVNLEIRSWLAAQ